MLILLTARCAFWPHNPPRCSMSLEISWVHIRIFKDTLHSCGKNQRSIMIWAGVKVLVAITTYSLTTVVPDWQLFIYLGQIVFYSSFKLPVFEMWKTYRDYNLWDAFQLVEMKTFNDKNYQIKVIQHLCCTTHPVFFCNRRFSESSSRLQPKHNNVPLYPNHFLFCWIFCHLPLSLLTICFFSESGQETIHHPF